MRRALVHVSLAVTLLAMLALGRVPAGATSGARVLGPPPRCCFAMAGDAATGHLVVFGGSNDPYGAGSVCGLGDTWTWDGSAWAKRRPASSPAPRCAPAAYDAARGNVVLWGGSDGYTYYGDTWIWDGTTWVEQHPPTSPPATCCSRMAYDAASQKVVLLLAYSLDTWTWDGTTWTKEDPARYPFPRGGGFALARDERHLVFFGGETCSEWCFDWDDTWSWDGATWFKRHPRNSPGRRAGSAIAYDQPSRKTILFSGASVLSDTWAWDGSTWAKLDPAHVPPGRYGGRMAYDDVHQVLVMFGGDGSSGYLGDTWTWDGTDWTEH